MVNYAFKLGIEAVALFDEIFKNPHLGGKIIEKAFNGLAREIASALYSLYSESKTSFEDLEEKKKAEELGARYNAELEKANGYMESAQISDFSKSFYSEDRAWIFRAFNPSLIPNVEIYNYRLYCSIHVHYLYQFVKNFIDYLFKGAIRCPVCGQYKVKFSPEAQDFRCSYCSYEKFLAFAFKIRVSSKSWQKVLRQDKVVMYFPDPDDILPIAEILARMKSYFEPKTMPLTHEIFPGLGYSAEPRKTDTAEYNKICQEKKEIISFGQWMTAIIANHFIKLVGLHKDMFTVYNNLKLVPYKERPHFYSNRLRPLIEQYFIKSNLLKKDPRLAELFSKMMEIEAELRNAA